MVASDRVSKLGKRDDLGDDFLAGMASLRLYKRIRSILLVLKPACFTPKSIIPNTDEAERLQAYSSLPRRAQM